MPLMLQVTHHKSKYWTNENSGMVTGSQTFMRDMTISFFIRNVNLIVLQRND